MDKMMKINLLLNSPDDVRSGYVNVDPFAEVNDKAGRVHGEPHDLSHLADQGEVTELVALDVLDRYNPMLAERVLGHWAGLLAHGGELVVSVGDMRAIARTVLAREISFEDIDILLHGGLRGDRDTRRSSFTLEKLTSILAGLGLKIVKQKLEGVRAVVVARRP